MTTVTSVVQPGRLTIVVDGALDLGATDDVVASTTAAIRAGVLELDVDLAGVTDLALDGVRLLTQVEQFALEAGLCFALVHAPPLLGQLVDDVVRTRRSPDDPSTVTSQP